MANRSLNRCFTGTSNIRSVEEILRELQDADSQSLPHLRNVHMGFELEDNTDDDVPEHDDEDDGGVAQATCPKTTEDIKSLIEQQGNHPGNLESPLPEAANKREKVLEPLASGSGVSRSSHVQHESTENHPKCEPAGVQDNAGLTFLKDTANPVEEGTRAGEGQKYHDIGLLARKAHLQLPDEQQKNPPCQSLPISGDYIFQTL